MSETENVARSCPFCGSDHTGIRSRTNKQLAPKHQYFIFVQCASCGARGSGVSLESLDEFLPDHYDRSLAPPDYIECEYNSYREDMRLHAVLAWNVASI